MGVFSFILLGLLVLMYYFLKWGVSCLKQHQFFRGIISIAAALFMGFVVLSLSMPLLCHSGYHCGSKRARCQSNLHQFDLALSAHCYPPVTNYPTHLSGLSSNDVSPLLFVCSESGNEPGVLSNASEWTDYIYTRGLGPDTPAGVPVIICPFHQPQGLNCLDTDHSTRWVNERNGVVHMLEDLMERGYEFHVSERVQRQFGGRLRSSENWGDTSHDWAKEAEFPEAVHRRTLWTGIAAIVGVSALLFIMGYWISRRVGHRIRNVLLVVTFVLGVTYVWLARDSGWQLRLMPGVNGMMYGKWLMPIICFAAGLLTSFSKIRRSHRAVLISLLVCVSSLDFISAAALSRPVTSDRYDDWVTLQSSEATCSPAACATLLQLSGILVSEQDMVRACLTTSRGTSWQGMYRGLSLLVANDCHVGAKKYSSVDEMPLPAIINAELRSTKDEYKRYHEEWGWEPGEPHTVVVFRTEDDDGLLVADPAVGLELWDRRALDVLWNGEALVILPGRKKR